MKRTMRWLGALALSALAPGVLRAQATGTADNPVKIPSDNTAFGGASAEFLELGSSARGMALGGEFSTIVDDVNALHYNPAGLPLMKGPELSATVMPYLAQTDYYWAGFAFPFADGDFGFGAFLGQFGFSGEPVTTAADPEGTSGETFGASEVVAGFSLAHAFISRFSAGATVKLVDDNLATGSLGGASARTVAFDFGTSFHTMFAGRPIRLAFVVQNLGGDLSHSGDALRFRQFTPSQNGLDQRVDPPPAVTKASAFPLPRLFRVGLGYDPVRTASTRLSLMGEYLESNNKPSTFGVGSELAWKSELSPVGAALRASWQLQPDERSIGVYQPGNTGLDGLNVGGGLSYQLDRYRVALDYTYRHLGGLGPVNIYSISFGWE